MKRSIKIIGKFLALSCALFYFSLSVLAAQNDPILSGINTFEDTLAKGIGNVLHYSVSGIDNFQKWSEGLSEHAASFSSKTSLVTAAVTNSLGTKVESFWNSLYGFFATTFHSNKVSPESLPPLPEKTPGQVSLSQIFNNPPKAPPAPAQSPKSSAQQKTNTSNYYPVTYISSSGKYTDPVLTQKFLDIEARIAHVSDIAGNSNVNNGGSGGGSAGGGTTFDGGSVGSAITTPGLTVSGGVITLTQTTAPLVTTDKLYNDTGDLYWAGNLISGAAVGTWTSGSGNVYRTSGNVGIGTSSPYAALSVVGEVVGKYFTATSTTATSTFTNLQTTGTIVTKEGSAGSPAITYPSDLLSGIYFTYTGTSVIGFSVGGTSKFTVANSQSLFTNQVAFTDGSASSPGVAVSGSNTGLFGPSAGILGFSASGVERMRITDTGLIGIATTTPYAQLSVGGKAVGTSLFVLDALSGQTASIVDIKLASTTKFLVDSSGNVGISSTTPWAQFSVNPNALGSSVPEFSIGSSSATHLMVNGGGYVGIATTTPWGLLSINANGITGPAFTIGSSSATYFQVTNGGVVGVGTTSPWATLAINPTAGVASNQFAIGSSTATNFLVNNAGYVGVASTSPWGLFSINADGIAGPAFAVGSSTATKFVVANSGKVGLGSTTPWGQLSILNSSTAIPGLALRMANGQAANILEIYNTGGTTLATVDTNGQWRSQGGFNTCVSSACLQMTGTGSTGLVQWSTGPKITFGSPGGAIGFGFDTTQNYTTGYLFNLANSGSEVLRVDPKGRLSLGSTTPFAQFSISTTAGTSSMIIGSSTATYLILDQFGNMGLGTATPASIFAIKQSSAGVTGGFTLAGTDGDLRTQYMTTDGVLNFYGGDTGTNNIATLNAAGAWTNASDVSYKENITDLHSKYNLATLLSLQPRFYTMKGSGLPQIGFIAQEMKPLVPEVVDGPDGRMGISYGNLVALTVTGIQDISSLLGIHTATSSPALVSDRLNSIELRLTNLESSGTSGGGLPFAQILVQLESLGARFIQDIAYLKNLVVEKLTIGSSTKPTEITVYDKNGQPGCMTVDNVTTGALKITPGVCGSGAGDGGNNNHDGNHDGNNGDNNQSNDDGVATTTEPIIDPGPTEPTPPTQDPVIEPAPEPTPPPTTGGDQGGTPPSGDSGPVTP